MGKLEQISEALMNGEAARVKELVQAAIDQGVAVQKVLNDGLIQGMGVIGERFKQKEIFVPEVLLAARAMRAGMEIVDPLLLSAGIEPVAKAVLGTVKGDVHDIGKNLVGIILKGNGIDIVDLGVDVPSEKFIDAVKSEEAQLLCMSSLLTTSMPMLKTIIEALDAAGLKGKVKTMVGGAVVTQSYADDIGADGYASNAGSAAEKAKQLLGI